MSLRWPATLPQPQVESISFDGPAFSEIVDVLAGPTRTRLYRRNATGQYEFEVWLTPAQAEAFEDWYSEVVSLHDGEWYAPWIGNGRILAFADEYEMQAFGLGWTVSGLVIQTRLDTSLCDEHLNLIFGAIYRDDGIAPDIYRDDGVAADIYKDDFPLELIALETC